MTQPSSTPILDAASLPPQPTDALPPGTPLGEFEIERVLSESPRGIVYLAADPVLQRHVALKEYLPTAWAVRGPAAQVMLRAPSHLNAFAQGRRAFIQEAQLLVRFDHPSLMRVHRCWEANGTAYVAMPYYEGSTLLQTRQAMVQPPSEAWLRALLEPLLEGLQLLHGASYCHLNIAPEHILLLADGQPVLFDPAARMPPGEGAADNAQHPAPQNGAYAPIEQYAETDQLRLGPWTDLYSLAAVVHFCISGRAPVPATARAVGDQQASLAELAGRLGAGFVGPRYSRSFLEAFDWALAVRPKDRPQRVSQLRQVLAGSGDSAAASSARPAPPVGDAPQPAFVLPPLPANAPAPLSPRELGERLHAAVKNAGADAAPRGPAQGDAFEASIQQALQSAMDSIEADEKHSRFNEPSMFGLDAAIGSSAPGVAAPPRFDAAAAPRSASPARRRARVRWWSRPGVRWSAGLALIALLAGAGALKWQGDRRTEQVLNLMAQVLPSSDESQPQAPAKPAPSAVAGVDAGRAIAPAASVAAAAVPPPPTVASSVANVPTAAATPASAAIPAPPPTAAQAMAAEAQPAEAPRAESQVASVKADGKAAHAQRGSKQQHAAAEEPATPRAACGGRSQFSLYYCMQAQCRKPAYTHHPQCRALREHDTVD